jgi:hypothetical protein
MDHKKPLQDRFVEDSSKGVREVRIVISGCTGGQMGERWH